MIGLNSRFATGILIAGILFVAVGLHASTPAGRYTISNGTVYDTKTKLTWQQTLSSSTYTFANAQAYCSGLSLSGTGWRVPTYKELVTILDYSIASGANVDTTAFPGTPNAWFWSSTRWSHDTTQAYSVLMGGGSSNAGFETATYSVRCVR